MNKEEITESVKWLKEEYSLLCQTANALPNSRSKRNIQKEAQMLKRIKQLLTRQPQKRTVARAWIEKELNAQLKISGYRRDYVHVIADIIVEIFTAFGIEVVEK